MRIVQIIASTQGLRAGGMEKHVVELAKHQAREHEVHLLAHPAFADALPDTIHFHPLPFQRSRNDPRLWLPMARALYASRADVFHAHGRKAGQLLARLRWFARGLRITTLHNQGKPPPTHMHGWIAVSRDIARQYPLQRPRVIYNGLNLTTRDFSPFVPDGSGYPTVIAIGRLVESKGFDLLLRAWRDVPNGQLWIVGQGPQSTFLQSLAQQLGIAHRVHFLGYRTDVPDLLAQAQLCVVPSRREGFSYVVAEALVAGVPVLSTDVPVANEVLPPAFIVPKARPEQLAEKIRHILRQLPQAQRELEPVFDFARATFTVQAMCTATLNYYQELRALPDSGPF